MNRKDFSCRQEGDELVVMGPKNETFVLPIPLTESNTYYPWIKGVVGDKPVIQVAVECHGAADQGLDHSQLFWGPDRVERAATRALLVREDGSSFVFVRTNFDRDREFVFVEHKADDSETELGILPLEACGHTLSGIKEANGRVCWWNHVNSEKTLAGFVGEDKVHAFVHNEPRVLDGIELR